MNLNPSVALKLALAYHDPQILRDHFPTMAEDVITGLMNGSLTLITNDDITFVEPTGTHE